ncbi:MAG: VWA domain-containing protein [Ruegeria sp.]
MIGTIADFHFLRPYWLIFLIPIALFWWAARPRRSFGLELPKEIAPHLAEALKLGAEEHRRMRPIDFATIAMTFAAVAVAGPAWTRAPNPLIADTAPLVIALKVTDSMNETDIAPSRLERAKLKIADLIEARAGAPTALIAYAGTPHRVAPLTEDANILRPLLEGLTPAVMPVKGDAAADALVLAQSILGEPETAGTVLFILDDVDPSEMPELSEASIPLFFLTMLPNGQSIAQLEGQSRATVVPFTGDNRDISRLDRQIQSAYSSALGEGDRVEWQDRGWLFAWPAALLTLMWFRRGWVIHTMLALVLFARPDGAYADGWRDWFLTPDQQGQVAMNQKDYARAGELFEDAYHQGYAKMKAGQYAEAAEIFSQIDTADAAFAEGIARIRNREYRPAIAAFETALRRQPNWPEAHYNLEVSKAILEEVESTREQSDTGEESGIGADDVVFDNETGRGTDTTRQSEAGDGAPLSADQWISSIDTDMQDFLRSRFVLENQERSQ